MRKLIFLILFLISLKAYSPEIDAFFIQSEEAINPYEKLAKAVTWVESKDGFSVFNKLENAVGWFQIRQVRVDDYNKRKGTNYKLEDFYDYELSRKMFMHYAFTSEDQSLECIARKWNGSGPKTIEYWNLVRKFL